MSKSETLQWQYIVHESRYGEIVSTNEILNGMKNQMLVDQHSPPPSRFKNHTDLWLIIIHVLECGSF
jgi:hypothetical protein